MQLLDEPDSRPTDEAILQQQNDIRRVAAWHRANARARANAHLRIATDPRRAGIAQAAPYVGPKEPLTALQAEYEHGNEVFLMKIERMKQRYSHVRRESWGRAGQPTRWCTHVQAAWRCGTCCAHARMPRPAHTTAHTTRSTVRALLLPRRHARRRQLLPARIHF